MTGTYTDEKAREIARLFASRLTDQELFDISQAIMNTCFVAAQAGHCSPHWIDLNLIGIHLGFFSLQRLPAHEKTDSIDSIDNDTDCCPAHASGYMADGVGE